MLLPLTLAMTLTPFASLSAIAEAQPASGYIRDLPPEPPAAKAARHRRIAERRKGPLVIVHRGATAFAPENTLEAYAAAMDYGADGCEVDIRRTADGVLALFHDDMLDNLTNGFGTVPQLSYYELLSLTPRFLYGTATRETRPPTFAALLTLARQRAMLLHLDIKEPDLEAEIARLLDAADAWDHVVAINTANGAKLLQNPKYKPLSYKIGGLYEGRHDMEPEAVSSALARPGEMIMVDDPRVAARALKRPPYTPMPLPAHLRAEYAPATSPPGDILALVPMTHLRSRADSTEALIATLREGEPQERLEPDGSETYRRRRTERILERAWAAQRLGELKAKTPEIISLLEFQVTHRSLHRDWIFHGLDGAMAARALGMLGALDSVPILTEAFLRVDPELKRVANPEFGQYPLSWTDFRAKMTILPALGELRCEASKRFLKDYLAMDAEKAREIGPLLFEEAARALLKHRLTRAELKAMLQSPHSDVRGVAILTCLDHPTPERRAALKETYPWTQELPSAKR